jgi:hypothetical protein
MERLVTGTEALHRRTLIIAAWAQYKSVAHLCAAMVEGAAIAAGYGAGVQAEFERGALFLVALGRTLCKRQRKDAIAGGVSFGVAVPALGIAR